MRQYRGKRIDNSEVVFGWLLVDSELNKCIIWGREYSVSEDGQQAEYYPYEVDPKTVGQYTGVKDVCGSEIYEGDYLEITCEFEQYEGMVIGAVGFEKGTFYCDEWTFNELINNRHDGKQVFEIMGNIHSNPELLEGAET